ncbi:MAG: glycosyltransferase family 2 protein [Proteobacteria bacterium]|nr:glycosyltransferase family 2 protein [Pseudomonadota bacterium]
MKISVIVTTYNRPDALKKVLEGLVRQTLLPHEIIIADDGSAPETARMLVPYLTQSDMAVHHVWQADRGFRAARIRNRAILKSSGEYLLLLDGDCIPERHFVADHLSMAEEGCFFQGKRVLVNQKIADRFDHREMASFRKLMAHVMTAGISNSHHVLRIPFFPSYKVRKLSGVRSCNMGLFKKDVIAINGFNNEFDGWGREDTEFVVRLFRYGVKRKENSFRAICYHLWHRENLRTRLEKNDRILENAIVSAAFFCDSGLNQLIVDDESNMNEIN